MLKTHLVRGVVLSVASVSLFALAGIAAASSVGDGSDYGTMPGYTTAMSNTVCAGHGAFDAFGKGFNMAGGANGHQTGLNNALLCGNRQGNL